MIDLIQGDKHIYKYVPFNENTIKSLIKSELWFSPLIDFNDPFDGEFDIGNFDENIESRNNYLKTLLKDEVPDYYFNGEHIYEQQLKHRLKEKIKQDVKDKFGICCFSKKPNDVLMWSHYAQGHTGLCLIFEKDKLINSLRNDRNDEGKFGVIEFGEKNYTDSICNIEVDFPDNKTLKAKFIDIISFKKSDWSYEEEVRLYSHFKHHADNRLIKYDMQSLKGIVFGYKTNPDNVYLIDCFVKKSRIESQLYAFNTDFDYNKGFYIRPGIPYLSLIKTNFSDNRRYLHYNEEVTWRVDTSYY